MNEIGLFYEIIYWIYYNIGYESLVNIYCLCMLYIVINKYYCIYNKSIDL